MEPLKQPKLTQDQIEPTLVNVLTAVFGTSVWDDSVEETARRVVSTWREYKGRKTLNFNFTTFPSTSDQMIVVKDIEFSSICSHHLAPFHGVAHIAYLPNLTQVGLSKIPRLVHHYATRPQVQEQLGDDIVNHLLTELAPLGAGVIIKSQHTCMKCRGVRSFNAAMVTSVMRGAFLTSAAARAEFMQLINI